MLLAIGPLLVFRFDLIPAVLALAALYAFCRRKVKTSWALLALGTATKLFPALLAPVLIIHHWRRRQYAWLAQGMISFVLVLSSILLPFVLISPEGFARFLSYHYARGLHVESVYASFLLVANQLVEHPVSVIIQFGSWNLTGGIAEQLAGISSFVILGMLAAACLLIYRNMRRNGGEDISPQHYATYFLLVIAVVLIASKVLSPQYLIWLYPLLPLATSRSRCGLPALYIVISLLTVFVYPLNYRAFLMQEPAPVFVLALRNLLLLVIAGWLAFSLRKGQKRAV